jgi:hypothetical protein
MRFWSFLKTFISKSILEDGGIILIYMMKLCREESSYPRNMKKVCWIGQLL